MQLIIASGIFIPVFGIDTYESHNLRKYARAGSGGIPGQVDNNMVIPDVDKNLPSTYVDTATNDWHNCSWFSCIFAASKYNFSGWNNDAWDLFEHVKQKYAGQVGFPDYNRAWREYENREPGAHWLSANERAKHFARDLDERAHVIAQMRQVADMHDKAYDGMPLAKTESLVAGVLNPTMEKKYVLTKGMISTDMLKRDQVVLPPSLAEAQAQFDEIPHHPKKWDYSWSMLGMAKAQAFVDNNKLEEIVPAIPHGNFFSEETMKRQENLMVVKRNFMLAQMYLGDNKLDATLSDNKLDATLSDGKKITTIEEWFRNAYDSDLAAAHQDLANAHPNLNNDFWDFVKDADTLLATHGAGTVDLNGTEIDKDELQQRLKDGFDAVQMGSS